jgi:hypothetical protein
MEEQELSYMDNVQAVQAIESCDAENKAYGNILQLTPTNLAHVTELIKNQCRLSESEVDKQWSGMISVFVRNGISKIEQTAQCAWCPCPIQIVGELCRVYINAPDATCVAAVELHPLRKLIEPFIVGVGNVRTEDIPEGFVVLRRDDR